MQITLKVTAGPHEGREFTFQEHDNFLVGRSNRAHFRLSTKDKYFSRIHFMVEANPPHCRLMDMCSRNGTYLNGERVKMADLKDGDEIKAGRTILRVSVHGDSEQAPIFEAPTLPHSDFPLPHSEPSTTPLDMPALTPVLNFCRTCDSLLDSSTKPNPSDLPHPTFVGICTNCLKQSNETKQPIAGFQVIREVGRGGMGVVYLALRIADGAVVALKTIIPAMAGSKSQLDRFFREASILRELDHPHIVAFRDMGESNGKLFFAMDFVQGTDASALMRKTGPLPVDRAARIICQLLDALEYAHDRGFVHRDIKPGNMLLTNRDGKEHLKLADFGLARTYQTSQISGLTMSGEIGGTLAFMAPEQITNYRESKPAVDQYSAAASLYNLLSNRYIFDLGNDVRKQILMILHDEPVPITKRRADVPEELAGIIHRSLAKEPNSRFSDVRTLRQLLSRFAG